MVGEIEGILDALNRAHVRCLDVGGVAVENFADQQIREQWIREKGLIDLFVSEPFDFDAVYARALHVRLEKTEATVIALEDLIALKRGASRPRDLEDIAALELLTNKAEESKEHSDAQ